MPGVVFVGQVKGACGGEQTQFRAAIDWGDGAPRAVDLPLDENGAVAGRHAFRRAGTYDVSATVTDLRTGGQQTLRLSHRIRNSPLMAGPLMAVGGTQLRVARFRDGNPPAAAGDFSVRVRVGGRTLPARVARDAPTGFAVILRRPLPPRARRVLVLIVDDRGAKLTISSPVRRRARGPAPGRAPTDQAATDARSARAATR